MGIASGQGAATAAPEEMGFREFRAELLKSRAVADDDLGARIAAGQERLEILLHRDAADVELNRARQAFELRGQRRVAIEAGLVDAPAHGLEAAQTVRQQFLATAIGLD